jgi:protein-S-isoprenylcysteine O-methyltransferase Ste14
VPDIAARIARRRVPLGFLCGAVVWWLAQPTWRTFAMGLPVAILGEAIRVWAAGHLDKGREVTTSGPYRFTGHPLYLGSLLMGAGLAIAAGSMVVAALAIGYLAVTLLAAIRTEERFLRAKFGATYDAYRAGGVDSGARRFSVSRLRQNREYRALIGLAVVILLLAIKMM